MNKIRIVFIIGAMTIFIETYEVIDREFKQLYLPFVSEEERAELRFRDNKVVSQYSVGVLQRDVLVASEKANYIYDIYHDALSIMQRSIPVTWGEESELGPYADIINKASVGNWKFESNQMIDAGEIKVSIARGSETLMTISFPDPLELSFEPRGDFHAMRVLLLSSKSHELKRISAEIKEVLKSIS